MPSIDTSVPLTIETNDDVIATLFLILIYHKYDNVNNKIINELFLMLSCKNSWKVIDIRRFPYMNTIFEYNINIESIIASKIW